VGAHAGVVPMSAATARSGGSGGNKESTENADRLYHCAECGLAADLGAIDEEDGQWYCKSCWEALLTGDDDKGGAEAENEAEPGSSAQAPPRSGYDGPVDEDSDGVAFVLSGSCGAGFCLSEDGMKLLRARGKDYSTDMEGGVPRMDPDLVALVTEDASRMSGNDTTLVVRRIPREAYDAGAYRIHNLDGKELLAIDPGAYSEQARVLHDLRSRAEEQNREWASVAKLLAAFHHVLNEGDQSDEERLRRLRKLAPAEMLEQASARPGDTLVALAESADQLTGTSAGGS